MKSTRSRRRMESETSGVEELSLATRKNMRSRRRKEDVSQEEEEDSEGVGDPTVTEASLRRSSRRHGSGPVAPPGGDEADTESGHEKHDSDEEDQEEDLQGGHAGGGV